VFSDFLNLFVFNAKEGLGAAIRALQTKGLFQSLAEPNLIATNGKEATFLAGGEYPYPVIQSGANTNSVTITFKEFGIRLTFTPTVLGGDLIHLKLKPEVSSLDFANAVTLEGFRVPALATRRTETEFELRDGQTFAVAGLMNNTLTSTMGKIPGIGDIPILGLLFKSRAYQKNQTELVVMITPTIIKKGQMGVSEGLPSIVEPYMNRPSQTYPNPDAYTGSPRYPADRPQPREGNAPAAKPAGSSNAPAPKPTAPATSAPAAPAKTAPAGTAPVPSRPIGQSVPVAPGQAQPATSAAPAKAPAVTPPPTREQLKKSEEDRRQAERLSKERARREAEIARKNAELAKKQSDDNAKREKALAEAAARLKEAQSAYQAEIEKAKGGSNEKPKEPGKGSSDSAPAH
jgi:hypothetical protein